MPLNVIKEKNKTFCEQILPNNSQNAMLLAKFHQIIDIKLILSNKLYHKAPIFPFLLLNIMRKLYKKAKSTQFFNNAIQSLKLIGN